MPLNMPNVQILYWMKLSLQFSILLISGNISYSNLSGTKYSTLQSWISTYNETKFMVYQSSDLLQSLSHVCHSAWASQSSTHAASSNWQSMLTLKSGQIFSFCTRLALAAHIAQQLNSLFVQSCHSYKTCSLSPPVRCR